MRPTTISYQQVTTRHLTIDLAHEPSKPFAGQFGQKSRVSLPREGAQGQVQIQTLIANLDRSIRSMAHWRPLPASFCAGTRPQFILKREHVMISPVPALQAGSGCEIISQGVAPVV